MLKYEDRLEWMIKKKYSFGTFPMIHAPLIKLQFLADTIADKVEWVKPVYLKIIEPGNITDSKLINFPIWKDSMGALPLAYIAMEIEVEHKEICGQSTIYFFNPKFCTVGILLHELAHMVYPHIDHGDEFQASLIELKILWNTILHNYGIV